MKLKAIVLFLFTIFVLNPVFANQIQESIINVDMQAKKEVAPDTAVIRFFVENSGINLADLKAKNDKIVSSAISNIKASLVEGEEIKTIAFSVRNIYNYKDKIRVFQKYEVKNGFEVKLKDLSKISKIIKIAMDSDVKIVDGLTFSLDKPNDYCNDLIKQASLDAKKRASLTALALNAQLSNIKSIHPYCSVNNASSRPRFYTNSLSMKADSSVSESTYSETIEPGIITISANVNLVYYLK
ncbi:MAG: SIMPL domain-containing protein [Candidatus Gastranaerophilales bacterium]|nr:SIMPL domain-containing protein [Candidatus Gastranaerophilales bacterium]